jgi:hypothetical protein
MKSFERLYRTHTRKKKTGKKKVTKRNGGVK